MKRVGSGILQASGWHFLPSTSPYPFGSDHNAISVGLDDVAHTSIGAHSVASVDRRYRKAIMRNSTAAPTTLRRTIGVMTCPLGDSAVIESRIQALR